MILFLKNKRENGLGCCEKRESDGWEFLDGVRGFWGEKRVG